MVDNPLINSINKDSNKKEKKKKEISKTLDEVQNFGYKYVLEVEIGDLKFSNLNGDIITKPKPYLFQSTTKGSKFKCLLNDIKGDLREKISKYEKVTINIGFAESQKNKSIFPQIEGLIWEVFKKPPNSVGLIVTDIKLELKRDHDIFIGNTKNESDNSEKNSVEISSNDFSSNLDFIDSTLTGSVDDLKNRQQFLESLLKTQETNNEPTYKFFTNPENTEFNFESTVKIKSKQGFIKTSRSDLEEITSQAKLQGDKVVSDFNSVRQISKDNRNQSNVHIDYLNKRYIFITDPQIGKRNPINRRSGLGSVTVKGWNVNNKGTVGATAVTTKSPGEHPTGIINVPEWGDINIQDKIIEELPFTWGDATKNGSRVPGSAEIENIIRIAKAIVPIYNIKNQNWRITSWYRPKSVNKSVGGASNSKHIEGHAIDFFVPNLNTFYKNHLEGEWDGGYALKPGVFIHLDLGSKRTWSY